MTNILITGSRGFIGKNLIQLLSRNENLAITEFTRQDTDSMLEISVLKSDFIFHLAGEVRPKSSDDSFKASNLDLTQKLIAILDSHKKRTPILFTSTVHAVNSTNAYGDTKRSAEQLIENYSIKNKVNCWIYRLPHIFGEGCKPNYNSVISTWIYNAITDFEIKVFNRDIEMTYCYVQDIIQQFSHHLVRPKNVHKLYCDPSKTYETTLGQVVDVINCFKNQSVECNEDIDFEFKDKLKHTYQWYLNEYGNKCSHIT